MASHANGAEISGGIQKLRVRVSDFHHRAAVVNVAGKLSAIRKLAKWVGGKIDVAIPLPPCRRIERFGTAVPLVSVVIPLRIPGVGCMGGASAWGR